MNTKQLYYEDAYKTEFSAKVTTCDEDFRGLASIELDQTLFFPEGGGQPSDRGQITGPNGEVKVVLVRTVDGRIVHQGRAVDEIKVGDEVTGKIDWNWRLKYMKIHSAGHLVHDVLMSMVEGLTPSKGSHGKKAFLEYQGEVDTGIREKLEKKVNEAVEEDLTIETKEATFEEVEKLCKFVPPNLPRDKKLRMIKIGDYDAMPDGGVHVKSTKEVGKVLIPELTSENGVTVVKYRVVLGGEVG